MKKTALFIISLIFVLLTSCAPPQQEEDTPLEHQAEKLIHMIKEGDLEIIEIDGCEYIAFKDARGSNHGFGYLAHKGNCTNPIHFHNQQTKRDSSLTKSNNTDLK